MSMSKGYLCELMDWFERDSWSMGWKIFYRRELLPASNISKYSVLHQRRCKVPYARDAVENVK